MKNKDKLTKRIIYIVLSVLTVLTGLLFVVQVQRIYHTDTDGDKFSREIVGRYIMEIIVPIVLWLVAVIASIVINCFKKLNDTRKSKNSNITKLKTVLNVIDLDKVDNTDVDYISLNKEKNKRKIAYGILAICLMILAIFPCMYLFNTSHYHNSDATYEVKLAVAHIWPFVLIGFILAVICYFYVNYSALNSITYAKKLVGKYKKNSINEISINELKKKEITLWCIRSVLIVVAIVFIISGIANGGPQRVYAKAAKICTECIGLG